MATLIFIIAMGGIMAGLLAGGLGVGGGTILVPTLLYLFHRKGVEEQSSVLLAVATSLTIILLTTSILGIDRLRRGRIHPRLLGFLACGALPGVLLAIYIKTFLPAERILQGFALLLLFVAFQMWRTSKAPEGKGSPSAAAIASDRKRPTRAIDLLIGLGAGFIGTILGVGGGIITIPSLHLGRRFLLTFAIDHSTALIVFISALATAIHALEVVPNASALPFQTWGSIAPAYVAILAPITIASGLFFAHFRDRLPAVWLRRVLSVLAVAVAVRLLLTA